MELFSLPMCFQYIEVLVSTATIITFYASETYFSGNVVTSHADFVNVYGQVVLFSSFVASITLLSSCAIWEVHKQHPRVIAAYNFITIWFLLSAGIIIMNRWNEDPVSIVLESRYNKKRNGGLVVGILCLVECALLASAAIISYFDKYTSKSIISNTETARQQQPKANLDLKTKETDAHPETGHVNEYYIE